MKRFYRIIAFLLCVCLCIALLPACDSKTDEDATETTVANEIAAADAYAEAVDALEDADNIVMDLTINKKCTIGAYTSEETTERNAQYTNYGEDDMIASVSDLIVIGLTHCAYDCVFAEDTVYAKVKATKYISKETKDEFLSEQIPPVMLDAENYALSCETLEDGCEIKFSDGTAAEKWAAPKGCTLSSSSGTAKLNAAGALTEYSYSVNYSMGSTQIQMDVTAKVSTPGILDLRSSVPEKTKDYETLDSLSAALTLLRASCMFESANICSYDLSSEMVSEAAGVYEKETSSYHMYITEDDVLYHYETYVDTTDGNDAFSTSAVADITDGKLVITYDDEEEEEIPIDEDTVRKEPYKEGSDLLPTYDELVDALIYDTGDYYLIEFSANDDYGDRIENMLATSLMGTPNGLRDYASNYQTTEADGYIAVEKYTYWPTAFGLNFTGVHTIEDTPCNLVSAITMAISLYQDNTYEEITGEPLPEEEAETKAEPVFYEVTGEDGQKMYLFGTIHVGDDRTAYLPDEIYQAFDSADALAVEFDTDAFYERVEDDEELQQVIAKSYYYLDGTSIENHIDSDLYRAAELLMRIAGNNPAMSDYMKPFLWSSAIENFYLDQGRILSSSKGMDNRLLDRARESEKEILDVESGEEQLQMLAGYSDAVQEYMLTSITAKSRSEYWEETNDLYELWCAGDEDALREEMAAMSDEERESVDEDELEVYDEYHQKMEVERNAKMLEIAEKYLNGKKVVFFAVGLAHLLGEGGLVDALRDAGYTVTRVTYQ